MTEIRNRPASDAEARAKVFEIVRDAHIAMMANLGHGGHWHARPMATGAAPLEGDLWFLTEAGSPKIEELEQEPSVLLTYSDEGAQSYVSISGTASISRERDRIHALWSEAARAWFPSGPDDPDIALIRVAIEEAEYWDAPSSAMIALLGQTSGTGEPPVEMENRKVVFP